jgi:hypothetical protein
MQHSPVCASHLPDVGPTTLVGDMHANGQLHDLQWELSDRRKGHFRCRTPGGCLGHGLLSVLRTWGGETE